jgi:hypothetical protein
MPRLGAISTNRAVVRAAMTRANSILVIACGYAKHEALLIEEARTVDCQGFFHSSNRREIGDGRETITTA